MSAWRSPNRPSAGNVGAIPAVFVLLLLLPLGGSADFDIKADVVGSGGGASQSATFAVDDTIGQPVVEPFSAQGTFVWSGFWAGAPLYDLSTPATPEVSDDGTTSALSDQLRASWASSDPESGIIEYDYAIGTSATDPGSGYIVDWKSAGTATEAMETGLSLQSGRTYYWYVKAKNGAGLWSDVGVSDGIRLVALACATPGAAKLLPDGSEVGLSGVRVTAAPAELGARMYVEDPMRSSAIAVGSAATVSEGDTVSVAGLLGTNADGERIISGATVMVTAHGTPLGALPTNLRCAASGPWQYQTASGLTLKGQRGVSDPPGTEMTTVGLLLQVHGWVMDLDGSFLLLNDGAWPDRTGLRVLRANLPATVEVGDYVRVRGISSIRKSSTVYQLLIRPRRPSDLDVLLPAAEGALPAGLLGFTLSPAPTLITVP